MASSEFYDYLVEIESWGGYSFLASRALGFESNGYDELLIGVGSIVQSIDPSRRSSCTVLMSNREYGPEAARFSDRFSSEKIEGKTVIVRELFRGAQTARTLFKGVVLKRDYNEESVSLELVESDLRRSLELGKVVDTTTFPDAKPSDVGAVIPTIFNDPTDVVCPVVKSNASSRLAAELESSSTADIALDSVEGFPNSGTVRIGREQISYTSLDTANNELSGTITRGASSTKAAAHIQGSLVVVVDDYEIAIDNTTQGTTVLKAEAIGSENRRYPLPDPDSYVDSSGVRLARWNETPTYQEPAGELEALAIELDRDGGSLAIKSTQAFGAHADYTESNYAELHKHSGNEDALIGFSRVEKPSRGRIKKVLAIVNHSGNNSQLTVGTGTSVLDTVEVMVETETGSPRVTAGTLSPIDQIDTDYQEIAEKKARRPVDVFSGGNTNQTGVVISPDGLTQASPNDAGFFSTEPKANTIDNNHGSVGVIDNTQSGGAEPGRTLTATLSAIPSGIPTGATLNKVKALFKHGGSGPQGAEINGATASFKLKEVSTDRASATVNSNNTAQVVDSIEYSPAGQTVADLTDYKIEILVGNVLTVTRWNLWEIWFEIDYTDANGTEESSGSVVNMFDVTSILDTWEKVSNPLIDLRCQTSNTGVRIYQVGFAVIYEPTQERVPDKVALSLDGGITGTPAQVIDALWRTIAGNSAGSISSADVSALSSALNTAGYTASAVAGAIRSSLIDAVQRLAEECRFRAYVLNDVLRLKFIEDISTATASLRIDHSDLVDQPSLEGSDTERQVKNLIRLRYKLSEVDDFRETLEDSDASSITNFGEQLEERDLQFVIDATAAGETKDMILDRFAEPFDQLSFEVSLDFRNSLSLLQVVEIALGWLSIAKFEIQETEETGNHTIVVRGRVL